MPDINLDLIVQYWRPIVIGLSVLLFFSWDKLVLLVKGIKLPSLPKSAPKAEIVGLIKDIPELDALEAVDVKALTHLRKRAVAVKDKELLGEIKNAASKFFDIHSNISDSNDSNGV